MKRLLLNIALICSAFPIYAMEHGKDEIASSSKSTPIGKDWVPGKSSAGILPFRITSDGTIEILITNRRNFGKIYKDDGVYVQWNVFSGKSTTNESPVETALREGTEEMAFSLDDAESIIKEYNKSHDKLNVVCNSETYKHLKTAYEHRPIDPGIYKGKRFSTYLYPINVTEFANNLISGHQKNDPIILAKNNEMNDIFYDWCETKRMMWFTYKALLKRLQHNPLGLVFFEKRGMALATIEAIMLIKKDQESVAHISGKEEEAEEDK